jgi:hypothetical protein
LRSVKYARPVCSQRHSTRNTGDQPPARVLGRDAEPGADRSPALRAADPTAERQQGRVPRPRRTPRARLDLQGCRTSRPVRGTPARVTPCDTNGCRRWGSARLARDRLARLRIGPLLP